MAAKTDRADVLILGAGVCGLAAASVLGDRAIVLERESRPGGLVRTECRDGYWFDHVIHLLYFPDAATERRVQELIGPVLASCAPVAWVECGGGTARFPLQTHLGQLEPDSLIRCIRDFAAACFGPAVEQPRNYEEMLKTTFGEALCELFFFPYNRKMWRRPLASLAPAGFHWNIARPAFEEVLAGALEPDSVARAYNASGWYPRPPRDAPIRGMEVLSSALASQVPDLRLETNVEEIDPENRRVLARDASGSRWLQYGDTCLCTLPLPVAVGIVRSAPPELVEDCSRLSWNRVSTIALAVKGPRPQGSGHWRYYSDERLLFTRLVFLTEFDPDCAPEDGWAMLAEVTERSESPRRPDVELVQQVCADIEAVGVLNSACRVVHSEVIIADPAYVVFTPDNRAIMERARTFLEDVGIVPLGRYGRWEYSSMGQVMRDGFSWAEGRLAGGGTR